MPVLDTSSTPPPEEDSSTTVQLNNEGFAKLWKAFRTQAEVVMAKHRNEQDNEASLPNHRRKVVGLLEALTKLMFGLDETKKAIAASLGSVELIIEMLESAEVLGNSSTSDSDNVESDIPAEKIWMNGLKAVKCSVIRNKSGRAKCRMAGVFGFFSYILQQSLPKNEEQTSADITTLSIVEETVTTLAAVCLGDDLNALQASVQLRRYVEQIEATYQEERFASMHQKLTYLNALFDAIDKEQVKLLESGIPTDFFDGIIQAEKDLRAAMELLTLQNSDHQEQAEQLFSNALSRLESSSEKTQLLDPLLCQLRTQRAMVRLGQKDYAGVLEDADTVLSFELSPEATVRMHSMRADAFEALGRTKDAKEALGKAKLVCPQDESIQSKLDALDLSKEPCES